VVVGRGGRGGGWGGGGGGGGGQGGGGGGRDFMLNWKSSVASAEKCWREASLWQSWSTGSSRTIFLTRFCHTMYRILGRILDPWKMRRKGLRHFFVWSFLIPLSSGFSTVIKLGIRPPERNISKIWARGLGRSLNRWGYQCNLLERNWANMKLNALYCTKQDWSKLYCFCDPLAYSLSTLLPPLPYWPPPFRLDENSRRGRVFELLWILGFTRKIDVCNELASPQATGTSPKSVVTVGPRFLNSNLAKYNPKKKVM